MKHMDIRTKFTKKAFKDSLVELMKTSPIRDIPIKAICAGAGVSRSTFYTYYDDQYALLDDIQNEVKGFAKAGYNKFIQNPGKQDVESFFEEMYREIANNHDSIQVLLSENGDINFQKKIIEEHIMEMKKTKKNTNDKPIAEKNERARFVFLVHGSVALIQDWIKHDMDLPIPEIAKLNSKIWNSVLG